MGRNFGNQKKLLALAAAAALTVTALAGTAYGRLQEWTSAEIMFTPPAETTEVEYSSDYLMAGGQTVLLADWTAAETTKTLSIPVTYPEGTPGDATLTPSPEGIITCSAVIDGNELKITLTRQSLPETLTPVTVQVDWQGLTATLAVNLLPETSEEEEATPEATTETEAMTVGHCGVINQDAPQVWLTMDQTQCLGGTLTLTQDGEPLSKVRYSLDGEHFTLLYEQNVISLPTEEAWDGRLLLDFSCATLTSSAVTLSVRADGYLGEETLTPQKITPVEPVFLTVSQLPYTFTADSDWGQAQLRLQLLRLETDADGNLTYAETDTLAVTSTGSGWTVSAAQAAAPGTYQILAKWFYDGICVAEQAIYFVLNTK